MPRASADSPLRATEAPVRTASDQTEDDAAKSLARGYFSVSTQFENVGDALINRELIRLVSRTMTAVVDVSRCPPEFLETLDIAGWADTRLERSRLRLFMSMVRDSLRGLQPHYFLNPGGYFGEIGRFAAFASWAKTVMLLALVAMRVRLCHVGVSYERIGPRHARTLRLRSALLHRHLVRDQISANYALSIGMRVDGTIPDLAFGAAREAGTVPKERTSLGISFRLDHDRAETTDQVTRLLRVLDEELSPLVDFKFVSQVGRDAAGLRKLSQVVKRRKAVFCDVSSSIEACEDAYADCSYVVGNRLHALLIGALSGAAPLAVIDATSSAKISGLFEDLRATEYLFDLAGDSGHAISACIASGDRPTIDIHKEHRRLVDAFSDMFDADDSTRES